jgi:hypothetical protein
MLLRKNMNHMMHHVITVLRPYLFLVFIKKKMATMLVPLSGKHSVLLNTYSVYYIKYVFRK